MQISTYKIKRSAQIVVPVVDSGLPGYQVSFPDQPYLRGKKIVGISAVTQPQLDNSSSNLFNTFSSLYDFPLFITLTNEKNEQFVQNIPAVELYSTYHQNVQNFNDNCPVNLNGIILWQPTLVVWPKSFIWFPAGVVGSAPNRSCVFTIYYEN